MYKISFRAMGSQINALVDARGPQAAAALEQVPGWFEEWEQALSRFRPESELNRLNQNVGAAFQTSPILWEVFQAALRAYTLSGGKVSPALLPELEYAGYTQDFSSSHPSTMDDWSRPLPPPSSADIHAVHMDAGSRTLQLPFGMRLDFGGVAKGWAAEQAAQRLAGFGPALVDAGGDIAVSGPRADGQPWPVGIDNPLQPEANLELLRITQGGVATSGRDFRRWQRRGLWQHHIIDPFTHRPAETDVLCATVIATDVLTAEAAAKTVLILGSQAGLEWIDIRPEFSALLVLEDGYVVTSAQFEQVIWPTKP